MIIFIVGNRLQENVDNLEQLPDTDVPNVQQADHQDEHHRLRNFLTSSASKAKVYTIDEGIKRLYILFLIDFDLSNATCL